MAYGSGGGSSGGRRSANARRCALAARAIAVAAAMALLPLLSGEAGERGVRVGIVIDGPVTRADLIETFRQELIELMGEEFGLEVPEDAIVPSDYTSEGVRASLEALYADPKVDLVIALGLIASQEAAMRPHRPKPTFAPFPVDVGIQGLPYADGASGVRNFNYLASNIDTRENLETFRQLVPFTHLALLVNAELARAVPGFTAQAKGVAKLFGIEIDVIPVGNSVDDALAAIGPGVDAVFVTPLFQLSKPEFERLARGFIERKLPSFSLLGEGEVRDGILAGIRPHADWRRMARRIALNAQRALLGEDPGTLPVEFEMRSRLVLNMDTARAIGFSPSWSVYVEARLLYPEDGRRRERSLIGSVREAIASNLSLEANLHEVQAGSQEVLNARSNLLPQAEFQAGYTHVDPDLARYTFGLLPENQEYVGGRVQQLIWDDTAWANFAVQKHLQQARKENRSERTLDIVFAASRAFLGVLRAQTLLRTERENLFASRANLELARVRVAVGYSGRQEELRWRSRIARDKQAVIDAYVRVGIAQQTLNQIMNRPIEEDFSVQEATLAEYGFVFGNPALLPYIDSPAENQIFRNFMVEVGLEASPKIKKIQAALEARERIVVSTRRAFYSPTVGFAGAVRQKVHESGAGANISPSDDTDYTLGLQLTFPLVRGGAKFSEARQALEEAAKLRVEKRLASQKLERDVRSSFLRAARSFTNITLSKVAAEAANENLAVVTDLYGRGAVGIIDLLDAQNAALRDDQAAANAVYDFLVDLIRAERAAATYPFMFSQSERDGLIERMKRFFARTP